MDTDKSGFIEAAELQAGYNAGALKKEVLATPAADAAPADKSQDLWFGNYQLGSITGFKYEDVNRNGKFDGADVGLANVKMTLTGTNGLGAAVSKTVLTGTDGKFTFGSVVPGAYTVSENVLTDTNNDGTPDAAQDMVLDGTSKTFSLLSGQTNNITYQWANYVYGSIHGVKFQDTNANGVWDKTATGGNAEPGLSGIAFDLYKFNSTTTQKIASGATTTSYNWSKVSSTTSGRTRRVLVHTVGSGCVRSRGRHDQCTLASVDEPDQDGPDNELEPSCVEHVVLDR